MFEEEVKTAPISGAYISGLHIEGARWDKQAMEIREAETMRLNDPMPVVHFKPEEMGKKKSTKAT